MSHALIYAEYMLQHRQPVDPHAHHRYEALAARRTHRRSPTDRGFWRRWFGQLPRPVAAEVMDAATAGRRVGE
jgi:hypothetical protein